MAVQQLASLTLSDEERAELKSLTMRRKTAQALAMRARIVLACAEGVKTSKSPPRLGWTRPPSASGAAVSRRGGWMGSTTSRARARHERSRTRALRR